MQEVYLMNMVESEKLESYISAIIVIEDGKFLFRLKW